MKPLFTLLPDDGEDLTTHSMWVAEQEKLREEARKAGETFRKQVSILMDEEGMSLREAYAYLGYYDWDIE
jgi:hypothetical protein